MDYLKNKYDVIVVGAGHAGCEAAIACARMGAKVLLSTLNIDNIALQPCNPAIGGPAKSTLVRENLRGSWFYQSKKELYYK